MFRRFASMIIFTTELRLCRVILQNCLGHLVVFRGFKLLSDKNYFLRSMDLNGELISNKNCISIEVCNNSFQNNQNLTTDLVGTLYFSSILFHSVILFQLNKTLITSLEKI